MGDDFLGVGDILTHRLPGSTRPNTWTTHPPTTSAKTQSNLPKSLNRAKRKIPKTPRLQADQERDRSGAGRNNERWSSFTCLICSFLCSSPSFLPTFHALHAVCIFVVFFCSFSMALHCSGDLFLLLLFLPTFYPFPFFFCTCLSCTARRLEHTSLRVLESPDEGRC
jgi:hypothetical protein